MEVFHEYFDMRAFPVNLDDPVGKVVGRRQTVRDPLKFGLALQRSVNALRPPTRKKVSGVFRFKTFEEADAWMEKMMANRTRTES